MAKNRKDEVPGASRGRGFVIVFGILDVFCAAFLVLGILASPGGHASVQAETLPAFEENADHYGAAADTGEAYVANNAVVYNSPTAPEKAAAATTAAPETTTAVAPETIPEERYAGFLFPESDRVLITEADIAARANSKELCQRAINEIYARYGYQFTKQENLDYFNQYSWYVGMTKITDQEVISQALNATEKTNVATLTNYMTAHNWG